MAWMEQGSIRGPQGAPGKDAAAGGLTDTERATLFGRSTYDSPTYGALRFAVNAAAPAINQFQPMRLNNGDLLKIYGSKNHAAAMQGGYGVLTAPDQGWYMLWGRQAWNADTGSRGLGLGMNSARGDINILAWTDFTQGRFGSFCTMAFLAAGAKLYPWTWTGVQGAQLLAQDRTNFSEYGIRWMGP